MKALALDSDDDRALAAAARWALSAAIVMGCHGAAVALGLHLFARDVAPGTPIPSVMIDLMPAVSVAPSSEELDVAPGPDRQQADAPPPEPSKQVVQETPQMLAPTPLQEHADIAAPVETETSPAPVKPDQVKIEQVKPKPVSPKPKPIRSETRSQSDRKPAPRTTATPKAERLSENVTGAVSGASSAFALASYNQLVAAHLQRFKQYPATARAAGEQGVARVRFTLGRNGQVLGSGLAGSSGSSALDGETVAMVRRAQPFPPIPGDVKQSTISFVVPVRFAAR